LAIVWTLLVCAIGMALAQDVYPGAAVYHTGWYNALDIALLVLAALRLRGRLVVFGAAIVVFTAAVSGLMGADTHTVIGSPGAAVRDDAASGSFIFPLKGTQVTYEGGRWSATIDGGRTYTGGFIFWERPRTVLDVTAVDPNGNHLTITQPTNASFLSPVLLIQQRTVIQGMNVAFDSFSVPAMRRNVKAVLFTAAQASQFSHGTVPGEPAILFIVADQHDKVLRDGLAIAPPGVARFAGGIELDALIESYPAIVAVSAPFLPILAIGLALFAAGIARELGFKIPSRSKT
jgi:hypothetical protein